MSQRPTPPSSGLRAILLAFALAIGTVIGLPVFNIVATAPMAHADVAAGDIMYDGMDSGGNGIIAKRDGSTGTVSTIIESTQSPSQPDVSPDGSRVAYVGYPTSYSGIYLANSDGSGITTLTQAGSTDNFTEDNPHWSPDGSWIAFTRRYSVPGGINTNVYKVRSDGTGGVVQLTTNNVSDLDVAWSPDGTKLTYDLVDPSGTNQTQIWIMNADGTNQHRLTSALGSYNDVEPAWSPDGSRIYFNSDENGGGLSYFGSSNGFSTTTVTRNALTTESYSRTDELPRVSANGSTVYFASNNTTSGSEDVFSISSSGGTATDLTASSGHVQSWFSLVNAAWPPAPPSNSTATFSAPSASDAPYTRQVTVSLSATGNQRFDLGWSTSSTTAPNTSYLQTITNMSTKKGPISFLGKYSGTGTTWGGGTQPDQDWYLWVRPVSTGGTAGSWSTPLRVHTPKAPIWAAVGDSFSSGHHEASDQPQCPTQADAAVKYLGKTISCADGASYLPSNDPTPNDATASWVNTAVASYNSSTHAPSVWQISMGATGSDGMPAYLIARSGAPTSSFGSDLATPGTAAWASGDTQSAKLSLALYTRYDSWNVVSMTGGADDTNWTDVLANWYLANWNTPSVKPWAVTSGITNCPDANSVYDNLTVPDPGTGFTVSGLIQSNLQGMETVAAAASPGVRILNVGYPNVVDSTGNSCYADSGSTKGIHSVVVELNGDHTYVSGTNVKYVDLTATSALGTSPVAGGYISTNRIYGYPHPTPGSGSTTGQSKIAATAISVLTGTGW